MKLKRLITLVLLFTFFFVVIKGYHLKSLHTTLHKVSKDLGFTVKVEDAWVKLNGTVVYKNVVLTDTNGVLVTIPRLRLKSSVGKLLKLQKKILKDTLDFDSFHNGINSVFISSFTVRHDSKDSLNIEGRKLKLKKKKDSFEGEMRLSKVTYNSYTAEKGDLLFQMRKDGVTVEKGQLSSLGGTVRFGGILLPDGALKNISCSVSNLPLPVVVPSFRIRGVCSTHVQVDRLSLNDLSDIRRVYAQGSVYIKNFTEDNEPLFGTAKSKLNRLGIRSLSFDSIKGDFILKNGRVLTENFECRNKDFRIVAKGSYRLKNSFFNMAIDGFLQPSMRKNMKPILWDALLRTDTEERKFSGKVRGVPKKYTVTVDGKIVKRGINSFFNNIFH